ncbi:STAS domain-containing protein [Streptomyces sp. NPDC052701]|uniref:STAS domain-containing protein n=1 Tax=Streptomyces sp. NPDC052701 TaxID=3155533 RepID=UPI0034430780
MTNETSSRATRLNIPASRPSVSPCGEPPPPGGGPARVGPSSYARQHRGTQVPFRRCGLRHRGGGEDTVAAHSRGSAGATRGGGSPVRRTAARAVGHHGGRGRGKDGGMDVLKVVQRCDDLVIVAFPEDVDLHTSEAMSGIGDRLLDEGCRHLIVEASRTSYLDSTGVTLLLRWLHRLEDLGGTLILTGLNQHLTTKLDILGLTEVFALRASLPQALAHFDRHDLGRHPRHGWDALEA